MVFKRHIVPLSHSGAQKSWVRKGSRRCIFFFVNFFDCGTFSVGLLLRFSHEIDLFRHHFSSVPLLQLNPVFVNKLLAVLEAHVRSLKKVSKSTSATADLCFTGSTCEKGGLLVVGLQVIIFCFDLNIHFE